MKKKLSFVALAVSMTASVAESPLAVCRDVQPDTKRLACYDQAVDLSLDQEASNDSAIIGPSIGNGQDTAEVQPQQQRLSKPDVIPETVFGKDPKEALEIEELESITANVSEIRHTPLGKLIVVLANRQIWTQTDTKRLALSAGDEIRIIRGMLNSFRLEKTSGSRRISVRRSD